MPRQTIKQLLWTASKALDPLDAELLLAHLLARTREYVLTHFDHQLTLRQSRAFVKLVKKRSCGVPLAYITGHKEFFGLDFFVNKQVLIPRPETELLVESALENIKNEKRAKGNVILIDIGTGTACISISILKTIAQANHLTIPAIATDISRRALKIARQNARRHDLDIIFLRGNLLEPVRAHISQQRSRPKTKTPSLIITANLPYLTQAQYRSSPALQHEPRSALVAKNNGLALYEELLKQTKCLISLFYFPCSIFLEIDPRQSTVITGLIKKHLPPAKIEIKKDLAGHERVVCLDNINH